MFICLHKMFLPNGSSLSPAGGGGTSSKMKPQEGVEKVAALFFFQSII